MHIQHDFDALALMITLQERFNWEFVSFLVENV